MVHLKADDNWSPDQDKKDQLEDGDIGPLLLQKKQNEHNMALCAQWDPLVVEDGWLKRSWESNEEKEMRMQLVLPRGRVVHVLKEMQNWKTAAHLEVNK